LLILVDNASTSLMWIGIFCLAYFLIYFLWNVLKSVRIKKSGI
jgi:hypothetical protein